MDDANKTSDAWLYNLQTATMTKASGSNAGIPSDGNEVITIGRATSKLHEWVDAEVSDFAMYDDRLLSEAEINQVIAALSSNDGTN